MPKKGQTTKGKDGRPSKYKPEYAEQAAKLCFLGATDVMLADFFKVTEKTINNWKKNYPEFLQSLKETKAALDSKVERSLFERAVGYQHKEQKILSNPQDPHDPVIVDTVKHYPPDSTSMIFWLKNRQPEKWRDKQEIELSERPLVKRTAKRFDGE
jgi:hypothetical protein